MILSHRQARQLIERSLDGPLTEREHAQLEAHLAVCETCRVEAAEAARLDEMLGRRLSQRWRPRPSTWQERQAVVEAARGGRSGWGQVWHWTKLGLNVGFAVLLLGVLVLFARPPEAMVEATAVAPEPTPEVKATADPFSGYITVQYEFEFDGLPGAHVRLYQPVCDGVAYVPPADMWMKILAADELLPNCDVQPAMNLSLRPGERRDLLLVYRNYTRHDIRFRFVPQVEGEMVRPFTEALCGAAGEGAACAEHLAESGSVWAAFVTVAAPEDAPPGTVLTAPIEMAWESKGCERQEIVNGRCQPD